MHAVACETEQATGYREGLEASRVPCRSTVSEAITAAAREIAETTELKAICCYTQSGHTAQLAAREKPRVPIIAITPFETTARRLSLVWGLTCVQIDRADRFKSAVKSALLVARDIGLTETDDKIAITAGVPLNAHGSTNILRVASLGEADLVVE